MNIKPTQDFLMVERDEADKISEGGILLLANSPQYQPMTGKVLAIGPGKKYPIDHIKVGDTILFRRHAGTNLKYKDLNVWMIRENDVEAVIENEV